MLRSTPVFMAVALAVVCVRVSAFQSPGQPLPWKNSVTSPKFIKSVDFDNRSDEQLFITVNFLSGNVEGFEVLPNSTFTVQITTDKGSWKAIDPVVSFALDAKGKITEINDKPNGI